VIARAADILRALQRHPKGLSLAQLSREVDLARSTVHRIVAALESERFVAAALGDGRIRLGPGLTALAAAVNSDLRRELRPFVERLHQDVNETVDLAVFLDDRVYFIDQLAAPHRLQAVSAVGVTFPLHCTANGKAFLAELSDQAVDQLLPTELEAFTPHTITSRAALHAELAQVRAEGVAFDREEHTLGISAVGLALRTPLSELVSITIPVPTIRFVGNEQKLLAALRATHARIRQYFETA
jgi:DNA-binding IclR family transcriptional regulator